METSFTINSSDYGVAASKCVYMNYAFTNIRNSAGDTDVNIDHSYSNGVLTITSKSGQGIARPSGILVIIYTD